MWFFLIDDKQDDPDTLHILTNFFCLQHLSTTSGYTHTRTLQLKVLLKILESPHFHNSFKSALEIMCVGFFFPHDKAEVG